MNDTLKNGIGGAIIGAGMMLGFTGIGDIDTLTDLPYETIVEYPGTDVYYTPLASQVTDAMWNGSMSKQATARYSLDGTRVIIKYNAGAIDRRLSESRLGEGYTLEEILPIVNGPDWLSGE